MRKMLLAAALLSWVGSACAGGPTAQETLPKLKSAIDTEVSSPQQNDELSVLVEQVSEGRHLQGLTRSEVVERIGSGERCDRHPICTERGFEANDSYYEVGKPSASYTVRYRPALIVGYNRFGKVERTFVLRSVKD
jgi:hypothetical protein